MNNNMDHTISNENSTATIIFSQWPVDFDDEEFRAGYPFTPVPLEEGDG
jgi:hypothetical protein